MERLKQGSLLRVPMALAMGSTRDHHPRCSVPPFSCPAGLLGVKVCSPETVPTTTGQWLGLLLHTILKKKNHSCHLLSPASAEPVHRKAFICPPVIRCLKSGALKFTHAAPSELFHASLPSLSFLFCVTHTSLAAQEQKRVCPGSLSGSQG